MNLSTADLDLDHVKHIATQRKISPEMVKELYIKTKILKLYTTQGLQIIFNPTCNTQALE